MKRTYLAAAAALFAVAAAPAAFAKCSVESEIKSFYDDFGKVINADEFAKDPSPALAFFDLKKVRLFDVNEPEEYTPATFKKHLIDVSMQFPGEVAFHDFQYTCSGNVAVATYLQTATGKMPDGSPWSMRLRTTDALEKTGGKWRIFHEHASLPLDDKTLGAIMTKKP